MKRLLFIVAVCALFAAPLYAQSQVIVGQPLKVGADHDGKNTVGYRLYIDGAKVGADIPLSALVSGSVSIDAPALTTRGTHTLQVSAYNEDAESKSDPLTLTAVRPAPSKPTNLRVTVVVAMNSDGTLSFRIANVQPADQPDK